MKLIDVCVLWWLWETKRNFRPATITHNHAYALGFRNPLKPSRHVWKTQKNDSSRKAEGDNEGWIFFRWSFRIFLLKLGLLVHFERNKLFFLKPLECMGDFSRPSRDLFAINIRIWQAANSCLVDQAVVICVNLSSVVWHKELVMDDTDTDLSLRWHMHHTLAHDHHCIAFTPKINEYVV